VPLYAAFLRGMNVGGRRITNADLGMAFAGLGFTDVRVYRASGNVAFETSRATASTALARRIERGLADALGYAVPTFVRSAAEVGRIAAETPFPAPAVSASEGKLHVAFLPRPPAAVAAREVLALGSEQDRLALGTRELYWLPRGRMLDSGLDLRRAEELVGPWTMRTKATIAGMAAKHLAGAPGRRRSG
jgi:uncharacterized protein (DUF1697 family)